MSDKIRVLIVDDSSIMREAIRSILNSDPSLEVIGMAQDGREAVSKTTALKPDVITMDLNMPKMSGLEAVEKIMDILPTPIIIVSSMDVNVIIKALGVGAMDFVTVNQDIGQVSADLIRKIKIASRVRAIRRFTPTPPKKLEIKRESGTLTKIVAIGVSTGGPQALQLLLAGLPKGFPATVVIVQHMTATFIDGLAEWLRVSSILDVCVARAGDPLKNSTVYLAPDIYNLKINEACSIVLSESEVKTPHIPSIDVMMQSVAQTFGSNAIGVILTGMGKDGVEGIKAIKEAGGTTIAQDEKSSVIFGMNKEAICTGCVDIVLPLDKIAQELIRLVV